MIRIGRLIAALFAVLGLVVFDGSALGQGKGKGGDKKEEKESKGSGQAKEKKQHKHENGKALLGDKIKKNGKHEFNKHGKHTAFVDVQDGKIRGVSVKHAEKGDVPVKKYKTSKKMVEGFTSGVMPVNLVLAQAYSLGTTYIGYAYYDDYGYEVIYWFPYEMIYDPWTDAIEYVEVY